MAIGNVASGVVKGIESAEDVALRQRAEGRLQAGLMSDIKLRERAAASMSEREAVAKSQRLVTQGEAVIAEHSKVISSQIKALRDQGLSSEQIAAQLEPLMKGVDSVAIDIGRDPSIYRQRFNAALHMPTASDRAAAAGQAEAAGALAKASALEAGGVDRATALTAADIVDPDDIFARAFLQSSGAPQTSRDPTTVPGSLQGKGVKWSPSRQRWFLPDGTSFNRQGVPQS